jgi:hypothetical protein
MPYSRALTPEKLAEIIGELDRVMKEAERLRRHATRQLDEVQARQQQAVTPLGKRRRRKPSTR